MEELRDTVLVHVLVPGKLVRKTYVKPHDQCRVLNRLFPDQPGFDFIYQGQLLWKTSSFDSYRVEPNSTIIAVEGSEKNSLNLDRWLRLSSEFDGLDSTIESLMNPRTRREAMRLHDLTALRRELRPRRWRKVAEREEISGGAPLLSFAFPTNLDSHPPIQPSTEALPSVWDDHREVASL
jgi:hypothetical protein